MAFNKGISLSPQVEKDDTDELQMAVKEVLCDSGKEWQHYEETLVAITVEESLKRLDANLTADSQITANTFNDLIFGEESQSFCIEMVDGAPILFPLQNMDLNSTKGPEKENPGKLRNSFTEVETITICLSESIRYERMD
ncbi:hypothetical protein REPUB_Repub09cG0026300 [Reevesia pubescens]